MAGYNDNPTWLSDAELQDEIDWLLLNQHVFGNVENAQRLIAIREVRKLPDHEAERAREALRALEPARIVWHNRDLTESEQVLQMARALRAVVTGK
jgi:predicted CoA-binding protein